MNDMRDGFIVEMTTSGCSCMPLNVLDKHYNGKDSWSDLTDGMERYTVGGYVDLEGTCPLCGKPVIYNEYLVVTDVKKG